MKKTYLLLLVIALISCNNNQDEQSKNAYTVTESTEIKSDSTQMYACSMDPDVKGKKGDKCTKCGMDLDVAIK
jgi:hypothetical protein